MLSEVLKEAVSTCKKYKCDLKIKTYPNVENIKTNSKVRMAFLRFSEFMKERHNIEWTSRLGLSSSYRHSIRST